MFADELDEGEDEVLDREEESVTHPDGTHDCAGCGGVISEDVCPGCGYHEAEDEEGDE